MMRRLLYVAALAAAAGVAYTVAGGGIFGRVAGAVAREALRGVL